MTGPEQAWVGRPLVRVEDPPLVRGWGKFVGDVAAKDSCSYAVFVRSPVAAGRIVSITAPSGVLMLTAGDLAHARPIAPRLNRPDYVPVAMPLLAEDVVRFHGEPLAVVVAASQAEAEDAAERVVVDIHTTPAVLDMDSAREAASPLVHHVRYPGEPNVVVDGNLETPGFQRAARQAGRSVTIEVSCSRQSAAPMEARASHAAYDRSTGRTVLHTTTQMPHLIRTGICDSLGIPEQELRVVAPDVGGGFGAKMCLAREDVVLVHLARSLKSNVAWIESRDENFLASWHSREQRYRATGSFTLDGQLIALQADIMADVGAYSCYPVTYGVEPLMAMAELPGPYRVAEYSVRARAVLSNKCPIAPYRGVSRPVQTLTMERLMDVAARELQLDPVDIRRINLVDSYPHTSPTGLVLDESSHIEALEAAASLIDVPGFRARQRDELERGRYVGLGFSSFAERTGYGTAAFAARSMEITPGFEDVQLTCDPSGGFVLRIGASPHGQGLRTSLAQIAADELGVEPSRIRVIASDTDQTPYGWGSFGSRAMVIAGGATKRAGSELNARIREAAGQMLECAPDDLEIRDGKVRVRGDAKHIEVAEVARAVHHSSHRFSGEAGRLDIDARYDPAGTFSNAVHVAEVDVDPRTGHVAIQRFLVVEDAGRLVNPMIVDGQVHGGVAQGVANALLEELVYNESGILTTASFMDFLPPTTLEVPEIEIHHLMTISPATATGAKGVGEGGLIGAPAAILNAISDALSPLGIEMTHMPATPARVRAAIADATSQGQPTVPRARRNRS
jgi:carbon-monoxide dehydrogenase large subunit